MAIYTIWPQFFVAFKIRIAFFSFLFFCNQSNFVRIISIKKKKLPMHSDNERLRQTTRRTYTRTHTAHPCTRDVARDVRSAAAEGAPESSFERVHYSTPKGTSIFATLWPIKSTWAPRTPRTVGTQGNFLSDVYIFFFFYNVFKPSRPPLVDPWRPKGRYGYGWRQGGENGILLFSV